MMDVAGKPVLIALGDKIMSGHDPRTGRTYWTLEYGDGSAMGGMTAHVVRTSGNRFFVNGRDTDSTLFELSPTDLEAPPKEVWKTRHIKNTYVIPVYHDGLIFGFNGRILACVDASTGELLWRSRSPGDGFPIMVDGHLVIATKEGRLSIAPASRSGYQEIVNIPVVDDDLVWATAIFVNKSLYVRSIESWARVDIRPARSVASIEKEATGVIADSEFGRFCRHGRRGRAEAALDRLFPRQELRPSRHRRKGDGPLHLSRGRQRHFDVQRPLRQALRPSLEPDRRNPVLLLFDPS
jgi:hypothetical protein